MLPLGSEDARYRVECEHEDHEKSGHRHNPQRWEFYSRGGAEANVTIHKEHYPDHSPEVIELESDEE